MSSPPVQNDGPSLPSDDRRLSRFIARARDRLPTSTDAVVPAMARTGFSSLVRPTRAVAFWSAVVLPVFQVALLARGLTTTAGTRTLVALVGLNFLALVVGHPYARDGD
jgi:hypothetical protein